MNMFSKTAALARMNGLALALSAEDELDPLADSPEAKPEVDEVDATPAEPDGDEMATQRAELNRRFRSIRGHIRSEEEPEVHIDADIDEDAVLTPEEVLPEADNEPVNDIVDADDVDYTSEDDMDDENDEDGIIEDINTTGDEIEGLTAEMEALEGSMIAIETFGINPTAFHILKSTGLLCGTAMESMALESIQFHGADDSESQMALEGLGDKLKETAAKWGAKVLSIAKNLSDKITGVLKPLWDKVTLVVKNATEKAVEGSKALVRTVKAHPIATVLAVIAATAAVAGVMTYTGANFPLFGAKAEQMQTFFKGFIDKVKAIKWPNGAVAGSVKEGGIGVKVGVTNGLKSVADGLKAVPVKALGYTKAGLATVGSQLGKAWNSMSGGVGAVGKRAGAVAKSIVTGAKNVSAAISESAAAGASRMRTITRLEGGFSAKNADRAAFVTKNLFIGAFISTISAIVGLVFKIVATGVRFIISTIKSVFGKDAEPAQA